MTSSALLAVDDLTVTFPTDDGDVHAVRGVSFEVAAGETVGVVGESGSGKSVSTHALLQLVPGAVVGGSARFHDVDLLSLSRPGDAADPWARIAMVFQDPLSSLHPQYSVGWQIVEAIRSHHSSGRDVSRRRAIELLDEVGIPDPARRVDDYPHQFSGGMRQRVMLAMALALAARVADRRRTDDRARRDGAGAAARPVRPVAARARHGRGHRHPRPRRRRPGRRPCADDVRRPDRRGRDRHRAVHRRPPPVHPGSAQLHARRVDSRIVAGADHRPATEHAPSPAWLCLRSPMPARRAPLPRGAPPDPRDQQHAPGRVRAPRRRAGPSRRGAGGRRRRHDLIGRGAGAAAPRASTA